MNSKTHLELQDDSCTAEPENTISAPIYNPGAETYTRITMEQRRDVLESWVHIINAQIRDTMSTEMADEAERLHPKEIDTLASMIGDLLSGEAQASSAIAEFSEFREFLKEPDSLLVKSEQILEESYFFASRLARGWFECVENAVEDQNFLKLDESLLPTSFDSDSDWSTLFKELEEFPVSETAIRNALKAVAMDFTRELFDEIPVLRLNYAVFKAPDEDEYCYLAVNLEASTLPSWLSDLMRSFNATNAWLRDFWKPYEALAEQMSAHSIIACDLDDCLMPINSNTDLADQKAFIETLSSYNRLSFDEYQKYIAGATNRVRKEARSQFKKDLAIASPSSQRVCIFITEGRNKNRLSIDQGAQATERSFAESWRVYNVFCQSTSAISAVYP